MEQIGKSMRTRELRDNTELIAQILNDPQIRAFIEEHHLSQEQVKLSLPKFNQFYNERTKFEANDEAYSAKGYQPILSMNEGYADVSYLETAALKEAQATQAIKKRIRLINLPSSLKKIDTSDINWSDPNRLEVYSYLVQFMEGASAEQRGLYLYGSFGVGKSYLMAYLANELSARFEKSTTLLHFPTFAVDIKDAINRGSVKEMIDDIKTSEVLVLDDLGAEQQSSWVRDDVLQVILQYRMQENLLTFFTSNLDFAGLERHLATSRSGDETWQAKRVMERIRFLAKEVHLRGENRR
ncbi:primosomal protein DnaI [Streptococcus plurextorum]|uniref:primosomal protein DnaI n=1 Tax=Streptococcus plurextorum TaxID=456876 RepID=UPI00041D329C|nr:primosomal protein DnaI [Streptococcus plurextorum]